MGDKIIEHKAGIAIVLPKYESAGSVCRIGPLMVFINAAIDRFGIGYQILKAGVIVQIGPLYLGVCHIKKQVALFEATDAEAITAWNLHQPAPDAMPMDAALISAYQQGFADGAQEQRDCDADETPHKDSISEGFQNWLSDNPAIRAALQQSRSAEREGLEAAVRAANLALFVIRKQGVMPNSSWQRGFKNDMAIARAALSQESAG